MNAVKITIITSVVLLGLLCACRKSSDVMLSAPTEPPEAILKPALLTATTISPAVEKPINVPDSKEGPTVTVAEGQKDAPKNDKKEDDDVLRPATAGLNVTKGSAVDTKNYLHKCVSGDTTESVAAAYGVEEKDICLLNGVRAGANLASGKILLLRKDTSEISQAPDVTTYTVVPGDTFSKIARTFSIAPSALMKMNSTSNSSLQIGDVLYVPHK